MKDRTDWDVRIDGDIIVYMAGLAADSRDGELSHSLYNAKLIINQILEKFPGEYTIYLSSRKKEDNFRYDIYPAYKANRTPKCKQCGDASNLSQSKTIRKFLICSSCGFGETPLGRPVFYRELRQYLLDRYRTYITTQGEADDALGLNASDRTVIASKDKDLLMIPCYHYRIHTQELIHATDPGELRLTVKEYLNNHDKRIIDKKLTGFGFKWFIAQLLLGDATDNIQKPIKGFGEIAVFNELNPITSPLDMWVWAQHKYVGHEQLFELNCKLLWISRTEIAAFDDCRDVYPIFERYKETYGH